jgi:predicted esterase
MSRDSTHGIAVFIARTTISWRPRTLGMESMEFEDVAEEMLVAYGRKSFGDAIDIVRQARPQFPERDSTLTFWEACLLSRGGEAPGALECLESGLNRGLSWHPRMLADPDLNAARGLDGWADFETRSAILTEAHSVSRPEPLIRHASRPAGTVVALHGGGQVPEDFFAEWEAVIPGDWTLVAPIGDVPVSDDAWAWPFDGSTDSLVESLGHLQLDQPIVMAGFSQGAVLAAKAAWNGLIDASGLILAGPGVPATTWEESKRRPVPLYAVAGTDSFDYEPLTETSHALRRDGVPVHLDLRDGLGHAVPEDFYLVIRAGLDWIDALSRSTDTPSGP